MPPMMPTESNLLAGLQDANATRYLSAVGLVILLYDHILTFPSEIRLIWRAPGSFPKYGFLLNRYLVLGCLFAVAYEMCGFVGDIWSDNGCAKFLSTCSLLALVSVGIANALVLLRVIILWDHRPLILKLMTGGFFAAFSLQVVFMIVTLVKLIPGVQWSPIVHMCITTTTTPLLIAVWAAPMLFEILVLLATVLNALDRPRGADQKLANALSRDGITYFLALTALRAFNLALATTRDPALTMLGTFFVWALTTTVLNRSLLRLRQAEVEESVEASSGRSSPFGLNYNGRASPFGLTGGNGRASPFSLTGHPSPFGHGHIRTPSSLTRMFSRNKYDEEWHSPTDDDRAFRFGS